MTLISRGSKAGRLRVGIELRAAARPTAGGIVAVLVGTLHELFRLREDIDFVVFCTVFNRGLMRVDAPNVQAVTLRLDDYFDELGRQARRAGLDVLFRGYPTPENPDFPPARQIFLIPDLQHEFHPEFFGSYALLARRAAFRNALEGAGAIMTISEYARQTIRDRTSPDRDVFVAAPSLPPEFLDARTTAATEEERATLPTAPFFLYPANLWPHKNHDRLLEAFARFKVRTRSAAVLVLTGSPTGWPELRARHSDLPVRHLGYVSATHLRLLYERAQALTFFSEFEGFGLPLLEAFESGTPILCSSTTSLPEVAGDAALMCEPDDVEGISCLLARIEGEPELRAELVARGRRRLGRFGWPAAASALADAIERVAARAERAESQREDPTRTRGIARQMTSARRAVSWGLLDRPRLLRLVLWTRAVLTGGLQNRHGRPRVVGFRPDNTLGECMEVLVDSRDQPREVTLTGKPLVDATLLVLLGGEELGRFELVKGERRSLVLRIPPGPQQIIRFRFVGGERGRSEAFLVEETDVFTEEHLHALG